MKPGQSDSTQISVLQRSLYNGASQRMTIPNDGDSKRVIAISWPDRYGRHSTLGDALWEFAKDYTIIIVTNNNHGGQSHNAFTATFMKAIVTDNRVEEVLRHAEGLSPDKAMKFIRAACWDIARAFKASGQTDDEIFLASQTEALLVELEKSSSTW